MSLRLQAAGILGALLLGAAGARAQRAGPTGAELDALTAEVAAELRCPVCRNQSVLESSAELSREMQRVIRERLAAGESPEQVKAYFVGRYGEWVLLKPEPRGLNLMVYVLPGVALLGGGLVLARQLRRWAARRSGAEEAAAAEPPAETGSPGLSPEDRRWLEEAIRSAPEHGPGSVV